VTKPPDTFQEQFDLFSSHGIVIQPHGAGEANILYVALPL
jgi:capsular polysaccharide biosynthesis protein